ncbi:MAG: TolC family protein [bacterium]
MRTGLRISDVSAGREANPISLVCLFFIIFIFPTVVKAEPVDLLIKSYKKQVSDQEKASSAVPEKSGLAEFSRKLEEQKKRWQELIKKSPQEETPVSRWSETGEQDLITQLQKSVTLELLSACLTKENLEIKAAGKQWEAVLEKFSQADFLDQILRQYQAFYNQMPSKVTAFPFPGITSIKGDLALKEAEIGRLKYRIIFKRVSTELELTFHERVYLAESRRILMKNIELLKSLEQSALSRYNTAKTGYSNIIKINVMLEKFRTDLDNIRKAEQTALSRIKFLLNLPEGFQLGEFKSLETPAIKLSSDDLYRLAVNNRQEIELLRKRIEKTNLAITMAEKKIFPDYRLASTGETSLPSKVWFGTANAYVREARLTYQSLQKELESALRELRSQLAAEREKWKNSERNIKLYEDTLMKLAGDDLKVSLKDYQGGKAGFMDLLEAEKSLLKFQLAYKKALKNHRQSKARLQELTGAALPVKDGK